MALDFPSSPVDGQTYLDYVYSSSVGAWLAANSGGTFPVSVANGGTGQTSLTSGRYLKGNGTSAVTLQAVPIPIADGGTNATTAADARINLGVGLVRLSAGSVANSGGSVSVTTNGVINVTGVNSVSINSIFTSGIRKYRILITGQAFGGTASDLRLRLRASGADSTSGYYYGGAATNGTTITGESYANVSEFGCAVSQNASPQGSSALEIYSPAHTEQTNYSAIFGGWTGAMRYKGLAGFHDVATAYDGFSLIPTNSAALTAKIQIFGYVE